MSNYSGQSLTSMNLFNKFRYYQQKYGILHAVCSYIGRHHITTWKVVGPIVTRRYLDTWLNTTERRIINLGGGSNCRNVYLTVDIDPRADAYVDITKPLPFRDASVDAIFCEEVIEHIDLDLGSKLLQECWRILVPGGVFRLTTPNLNWFICQATKSTADCQEINNIFYSHRHCYIYTEQALQAYCHKAGFINLKISSYKDPESKLGYLDSHPERFHHLPEISQYLEMEKPNRSNLYHQI
jgi:predicted SAM-dependent methyltransferase